MDLKQLNRDITNAIRQDIRKYNTNISTITEEPEHETNENRYKRGKENYAKPKGYKK